METLGVSDETAEGSPGPPIELWEADCDEIAPLLY